MQIGLKKFLQLIRNHTSLATSNFSYAIYASETLVKNCEFVYTDNDWIIPYGTHLKFMPADKKKIPDYIRNVQLSAMSIRYNKKQRFVGYNSLDIIPDSGFLYMMITDVFEN
jgi:hypothetical protein